MNKAVHALVYVILAVAGVALYFEMNLFDKKELLKDSNEQLRNCIVKLSSYIEAEDATKATDQDASIDVGRMEAREEDNPDMENLLKDYQAQYEQGDLKLMKWGDAQSAQLRQYYALDAEGNKQDDPANPGKFLTKGERTAQALVDQITDRAARQYEKLGKTRNELASVRSILQDLAKKYNELPKKIREHLIKIDELEKEIKKITEEKEKVESDLAQAKKEVDSLKDELASAKDELASAKDETEAVKEDLEKEKKKVEHLTNLLKTQAAAPRAAASPVSGEAHLTMGEKGVVKEVGKGFVIVEFTDEALDELIGSDRNGALAPHQMLVMAKAKGADGKETRKVVGRVRLRQLMPKTKLVVADVMADWTQEELKKDHVIYAE